MSEFIVKNLINECSKNKNGIGDDISSILNQFEENYENYPEDKINIDEYELAEEEKEYMSYMNLLNIYTCYYKKLFVKNKNSTMFDDIDYEKIDSTNKCLELLYNEIYKFDQSKEDDRDILYEPDDDLIDIDQCKELYSLYIGSEPKFTCKNLLPLLKYMAETYNNWTEMAWSIIPLKS